MQGSSVNNRGMNIDLTLKELERCVQLSFKGHLEFISMIGCVRQV